MKSQYLTLLQVMTKLPVLDRKRGSDHLHPFITVAGEGVLFVSLFNYKQTCIDLAMETRQKCPDIRRFRHFL